MTPEKQPASPSPPSLGRIVLFRESGDTDRAAIIIEVPDEGDQVTLAVFTPHGSTPHLQHHIPFKECAEGELPEPGTWRYPERVY